MRRTLILFVIPLAVLSGAMASPFPATAAVAETTTDSYQVSPASPKGQAAVHEVTAVLVSPAGTKRDYTRDTVIASLDKTAAYFERETDGFVRFTTVSVSDWVQPDDPSISCSDKTGVESFARKYANWTPGPNKHLMAFVPDGKQCSPVATGSLPSSVNTGGVTYIMNPLPAIVAHELGHNLTLYHASSIQCQSSWDFDATTGLPTSCTRTEYGNTTDLMGSSYAFYPLSAPSLDRLGLISHRAVPKCGATRRIPLQTMSAGAETQRVVSWDDPSHQSIKYYVQYSDKVDQSAYDGVWKSEYKVARPSGVQILRSDPQSQDGGTILVRPGDSGTSKQLVSVGEKVALSGGMSVSVASMDESSHTAEVDVTVPCPSAAAGARR